MSAKVFITGKITGDIKKIGNESNKGISITLRCRDGKSHNFIPCIAWGNVAQHIQTYTTKGSIVEVVGRIKPNSFIKENTRISTLEILIDEIDFLSKNDNTIQQSIDFSREEI